MHYHIVKSTKRAKETQKQTRYQQQSDFALCWLGVSAPVTCPSTANYRHKINRTNFRKDICAVLKERRSKHSHFINRKDISFTVTRDGDILLLHPSPAKFHGDIVDALHRGRRREWGMGIGAMMAWHGDIQCAKEWRAESKCETDHIMPQWEWHPESSKNANKVNNVYKIQTELREKNTKRMRRVEPQNTECNDRIEGDQSDHIFNVFLEDMTSNQMDQMLKCWNLKWRSSGLSR